MHQPRFRIESLALRRATLTLGVLCLLLLLTVMVSPSARAFAEDQIRQIGALIFRPAGSEAATSPAPTALPTALAPGDTNPPENATLLEDASRLAGFTVLEPGYLPDGYQVASVWSIDRRDTGVYVVSTFRNAANNQFLLLNQIDYSPGASFEQTYGINDQLSDVTVNGMDGVWITGRPMTDPTDHSPKPASERELYPTDWLVWPEGNITYTLIGNGLTQEEMIRIAESLGR